MDDAQYTIIREGLYNESWPLYLGYYAAKDDERTAVVLGGDSPISWTSISDLGLANALVLADSTDKYIRKTFYLSSTKNPKTLADVAQIVSKYKGKSITTKIVSRQDHEHHYTNVRNMPEDAVKWWSTSYDALRDGECLIRDTTLEDLLSSKGRKPKPVEETIHEMIAG